MRAKRRLLRSEAHGANDSLHFRFVDHLLAHLCRTLQMSHGHGWRDSCAAGGVTDMAVGSGDWFGLLALIAYFCHAIAPKHCYAIDVVNHLVDLQLWSFEQESIKLERVG